MRCEEEQTGRKGEREIASPASRDRNDIQVIKLRLFQQQASSNRQL
jgi:hypothetical protein